jgi:pyruvate,water dikinase
MNETSYIAWPGDDAGRPQIGGKAAALDALSKSGFPVPVWFVLTPRACADSRSAGDARDAAEAEVAPSPAVERALDDALRQLESQGPEADELRLAVRSSAPAEDGAARSFAGQLESFLGVAPSDVKARVADVWRSAFAAPVRAYRRAHGLPETPPAPPAVLVQRVVRAHRAGVAFSADPTGGRRNTAVASAVRGLGSLLVDGAETGDTFRIGRDGAVTGRDVTRQHRACRFDANGDVHEVTLSETEGAAPTLTDEQARRVAELARQAENHFDAPQDIEWAFDEADRLHLLQSRPITTLDAAGSNGATEHDARPAPRSSETNSRQRTERPPSTVCRPPSARAQAKRTLWDNSNIAESYGGVTTPLTFSFARRAYRAVYRAFCRAMGVPRAKVEQRAGVFRSMVGLVRGRIYYDLQSWYEVLRLLPGFRFNRAFMEDMMGVSERLPDDFLPEREPASFGEQARDAVHLARSTFRLAQAHRQIDARAEAFQQHVDRTLAASPASELEQLRLGELADRYTHLEDALLGRWETPIVNDVLTMIFFGLSRRLLAEWTPDGERLHGALLAGAESAVSAEPARRIGAMAEAARGDAALVTALREGTRAEAETALRARPELAERYEAYLSRFGDRCLGELKLESETLREDPLPLLRAVGTRAARGSEQRALSENAHRERRTEAETQLAEALRGHPVRRRVVRWSLRHARARIATRENLRFERTRVFGTARRLFLEMGRRLAAEGRLDEARNVFYLEVEEILDFARGTATTTDLAGLASVRNDEFARYRERPAPPDRFVTRGAPPLSDAFEETSPAAPPAASNSAGDVRTGQGSGAGAVRGPACVVEDPRSAELTGEEILVARQTDPGWTPLFASCAGVVVERGNLLSHAAVVAREMGLPAVVGVDGATDWLAGAGRIEVDGRAGTVRVLAEVSDGERRVFAP